MTAATIAAAVGGGLAGTLSVAGGSSHGSADGGTCAAADCPGRNWPGVRLHRVIPADPTMDAQCTIEPDGIPPYCVQGDYQVALSLGAPCANPQYPQTQDVWRQTYTGSSDIACLPAH